MTATTRASRAAKAATGASAATRIAAVTLLGALALTGCDSGGSGATDKTSATPDTSVTATGDDGGAGGTGGPTANGDGVEGSWLATTGGEAVVLTVTGKQAALFSTDRTICTGTAVEEGARRVIRLDACKARTTGTVDSVNRTTLRVTWEGGLGSETYTRSTGGTLPSGLPTASLGS
ncbi:hypothetical protein ACFC08_23995 [Streptomyces sp. NPDC056112]|uniref:hypothetical protein n=1 Tax=unclassified Streptomyces TaxID=2593676 RepID=UPI001CD783D9|nr:hypothetical protein [Streptomyces sp. CoT10]